MLRFALPLLVVACAFGITYFHEVMHFVDVKIVQAALYVGLNAELGIAQWSYETAIREHDELANRNLEDASYYIQQIRDRIATLPPELITDSISDLIRRVDKLSVSIESVNSRS